MSLEYHDRLSLSTCQEGLASDILLHLLSLLMQAAVYTQDQLSAHDACAQLCISSFNLVYYMNVTRATSSMLLQCMVLDTRPRCSGRACRFLAAAYGQQGKSSVNCSSSSISSALLAPILAAPKSMSFTAPVAVTRMFWDQGLRAAGPCGDVPPALSAPHHVLLEALHLPALSWHSSCDRH